MAIRVLFDTNLLISYLLTSNRSNTVIGSLFEHALTDFTLVLPVAVLDEFTEKVAEKPSLMSRISQSEAERFRETLYSIAEITPSRSLEVFPLVRDPDDDYLVAYAIDDQVDYLVSGDKDLLALGDLLAPLKIRSPQAFLEELDSNLTDS